MGVKCYCKCIIFVVMLIMFIFLFIQDFFDDICMIFDCEGFVINVQIYDMEGFKIEVGCYKCDNEFNLNWYYQLMRQIQLNFFL